MSRFNRNFRRYVEIDVDLVKVETAEAFLFVVGGEELWFPKSQIKDGEAIARGEVDIHVEVTRWIAEQKEDLEYRDHEEYD